MISLIAALVIAGATPSPEITFPIPGPHGVELMSLCQRANDASMESPDPTRANEIFVGRLEIDMSQHDFSERDKVITRQLCRAFQSGYTSGLEWTVKLIDQSYPELRTNPR